MKKALTTVFMLISAAVLMCGTVFAEDSPVSINVNGNVVAFSSAPVIRDGTTIADAQVLADALGFRFVWYDQIGSATISNSRTSICITLGNEYMTVSDLTGTSNYEYLHSRLSFAPLLSNGRLLVSVRDIAGAFGYELDFDQQTATVYIGDSDAYTPQNSAPLVATADVAAVSGNHTYYFQNQEEFSLPGFGSGYCWVCSYAMVLSDVTGTRITPSDVEAVNKSRTSNGAYCYHYDIAQQFGVHFVSTLDENSIYYGGRDMISGGTIINNPEKSDSVVSAALKEALTLHPEGVMVRYSAFPHTMVAVGFSGDTVLFNDPAPTSSGAYSQTGKYNSVPFEQTCVAKKGFKLSDITFMQAISK